MYNFGKILGAVLFLLSFIMNTNGAVKLEKIAYGGWQNCLRLTNGKIELIATTDVGPRIIHLALVGGTNIMKQFPDHMGKTSGEKWLSFGGHRLWHAPEVMPRTYAPDFSPVQHDWDGKTLKLVQNVEATTGLQKEIEISIDPNDSQLTVLHRLRNKNLWEVEAAAWALTVMAGPGRAIFPQEPFVQQLLPVRPLVLWGYTNMKDSRWNWGTKYLQVKCDPAANTPQKFGARITQGWGAFARDGVVFIKHYPFDPHATYPDFNCNAECYTRGDMLEVESVGALTRIPAGGEILHEERWGLFKADIGEDEKEIDEKLLPLVKKIKP